MAMASLLHKLRLDTYALIAGLLHDTVEDTEVSSADLRGNFGVIVSRLVDGVTKNRGSGGIFRRAAFDWRSPKR